MNVEWNSTVVLFEVIVGSRRVRFISGGMVFTVDAGLLGHPVDINRLEIELLGIVATLLSATKPNIPISKLISLEGNPLN